MAREEEYEYDSSSAPSTPKNSEGHDEKKKHRGIKKLISFTKKKSPNNLDKSPSLSEREIINDEGGGSQSRRRSLTGFFKLPRSSKNDETKPQSYDGKTQTLLDKNETHERVRVEASKEENKHYPPAEKTGEEPKQPERAKEDSQNHPPKPTQATTDDKGKPKEHQETRGAVIIAHAGQGKEVVGHDQQHHHKQIEDPKLEGDAKDEQLVATEFEAAQEESRDLGPPPPPPLQEKEHVGCESLVKGLQHVCLPWTVNKEDH